MTRPPTEARAAGRAALVLAALLAIAFWDVLFAGRTVTVSRTIATVYPSGPFGAPGPPPEAIPVTDNSSAVVDEPYLAFKRHELGAGRLPLWNPHQAAGMPFAANPVATLFAPAPPLYLLPRAWAWDVFVLGRLFAAGFLLYVLLRLLGLAWIAAVGGGVAYALSGPLVAWLANETVNPECLLPLLLVATELVLRGGRRWALPLAAAVVGATILAGHPEHAFYALATALLFAGWRAATAGAPEVRRRLVHVGAAWALGAGLAAVLLLPFAELIGGLAWNYHGPGTGVGSEEDPARAVTLLAPYLFQDALVTRAYEHAGWLGGYLGAATLGLALLGIRRDTPRGLGLPLGALFLVALAKCYGVPGVDWLGTLPVLDRLRFSLHLPPTIALLAAVLVGLGLDGVARGQVGVRSATAVAAALGLAALGFVLWHLGAGTPLRLRPALAPAALVLCLVPALVALGARRRLAAPRVAGALVVLLAAELLFLLPRDRVPRHDSFAEAPYVRWLRERTPRERVFGVQWALFPNTATAFGVDDLGTYGGLQVGRYVRFVRALLDPGRFPERAVLGELRVALPSYTSPFLDLLNVRYLVAPADGAFAPPQAELAYDADARIYRRPHAMPRAWTVRHWEPVAGEADALARLAAGYDFRTSALVEDAPGAPPAGAGPHAPAVPATVVGYGPNEVAVDVTTEGPALLVLADTYYPGWQATVDGEPAPVLAVNALLRGVPLPAPGTHAVRFRFRPRSFLVGAALSLLSLAVVVALAARQLVGAHLGAAVFATPRDRRYKRGVATGEGVGGA